MADTKNRFGGMFGGGLRTSRLRWLGGCLLAAAVVVGFTAFAPHETLSNSPNRGPVNDRPWMARVVVWPVARNQPVEKYEVRDEASIGGLLSMFKDEPARQLAEAAVDLEHPRYSIELFRPSFKSGQPETIHAGDVADGQAWVLGDQTYQVDGDLPLFLEGLAARRLAQLLASDHCTERASGLITKAADGDRLVGVLTALAASANPTLQRRALWDLSVLVQGDASPAAFPPQGFDRRKTQVPTGPYAAEARRVAMAAIERLKDRPYDPETDDLGVASDAFRMLRQVGDERTGEWLAEFITGAPPRHLLEYAIESLETIDGLPPIYERIGICGNSTPEELEKHGQAQQIARLAGRDKLLAWHEDHAGLPVEERMDAVLREWRQPILDFAVNFNHYEVFSPRLNRQFDPLLRQGEAIVPAIRRRQSQTGLLHEQGTLEMLAACVTGKCNLVLVDQLLTGNGCEQILACKILDAAGCAERTEQLDALQRTPDPTAGSTVGLGDLLVLRSAASSALYSSLGPAALPRIKAAFPPGRDNQFARMVMEFYTLPQK